MIECVVEHDLDNFVMGEVKDFSSINNLRVLLSNEGFQHVRLAYLGGLWVMIELTSVQTKMRFLKHVGVASWFSQLCKAQQGDSFIRERIVWIDIEGVPLHALSLRLGLVGTKLEDNILEKFKIIVRGKNFVIRAKELFVWSPTFNDNKEVDDYSEDDSVNGAEEINGDISKQMNLDDETDIEAFTIFINKRDKGEANSGLDSSIPFPPGFTPEREFQHVDAQEGQGMENSLSKRRSEGLSSRVLEDAQPLNEHASPSIDSKKKAGGSILEVIDDMIKVGQSMGFTMEGCLGSKAKKDWIKELNNKHKVNFLSVQETKLDCISDMDVKVLWGNYKFEYTISEAVGNSGGILCVWDPSAKLLVVSIYAPQSITSKRSLWSYISSLISRWDGHCMVMGDFNEVRCMEDRLGSVYNAQGVYVDGEWVDDPWAIEAGIFKGIKIGSSLNISHLFYADDAVFIGEWSIANLSGVMVGGNSSTLQAWDDTIGKLKARLSNWKLKTLSVGGRLTLLKSVLGSTPIYNMSIYKVPKSVLQTMESIRRNFFNGVQCDERKIVWIKWAKVLASKKYGGLGVSSFYALNRALLFKWVWRFISRDNSLWCRLIMSMHGSSLYKLSPFRYSTWKSIIREVHMLKDRGVDLISHCHIRVGNGLRTQFWNEVWIGDTQLRVMFPRIYALEINKDCTVADKLQFSVTSSLRRSVRGGVESSQLALLQTYIEGTLLSNMEDRWVWDLNGEGVFRVKDVRILLDECFLPKAPTATRWVKYVPIKINVFAWKVFLDRLPTRSNLQHRGVLVSDLLCPLCSSAQEDSSHLFFSCRLATDIVRLVCRWWNLSWTPLGSYADWLNWFNSIRLSSKVKDLLEGVLYITWWSVWMFRNQLLFSLKAPRKDVIFDDIVSRSFTWCLSRFHITFAMLNQQDIYAVGSENRPPMLNKDNYVPWSSRLLCYAKIKPNGKLIYNSIMHGPYVRRLILEPGDPNCEVPVAETFHEQTDDELTDKELKQMEADDQAIETILMGLPKDIYADIDSCETAQEIWLRVQQMMKGSDIGV
ncbi:RNA-directed DNA polymerase, eukaryota [Tanacetum coccineum]